VIRINLIRNSLVFLVRTAGLGVGAGNAEYWMEVSKPGFARASTDRLTGESGQVLPEKVLHLYRSGGIEGIAVLNDGTPLADTPLDIKPECPECRPQTSLYARTDATGAFLVREGIPAAAVTIHVSVQKGDHDHGLSGWVGPIDLAAGQITTLGQVVLSPEP
jgi:hypothetical protein